MKDSLQQEEKRIGNDNALCTERENGYDGYYDDILPIDADDIRTEMDFDMVKRIVIMVAGGFTVICACVVMMYLL